MIEAFENFGGIPKTIVFDNMKTVVNKPRTNTNSAEINNKFYQFSKDMGFEIITCKGYRPKTKGKTEASVRITNRLNVYNHEFVDWNELENILIKIMTDINTSVSQAHNKIPNDLLKVEKEYLIKLPAKEILDSYTNTPIIRKVSKESLVQYNNNKYSVPTQYIDKDIEIKIYNSTLEIYFNTELIRSHELIEKFSRKIKYNEKDLINILKSDAFKYKKDEEIQDIATNMLNMYDALIGGKNEY